MTIETIPWPWEEGEDCDPHPVDSYNDLGEPNPFEEEEVK